MTVPVQASSEPSADRADAFRAASSMPPYTATSCSSSWLGGTVRIEFRSLSTLRRWKASLVHVCSTRSRSARRAFGGRAGSLGILPRRPFRLQQVLAKRLSNVAQQSLASDGAGTGGTEHPRSQAPRPRLSEVAGRPAQHDSYRPRRPRPGTALMRAERRAPGRRARLCSLAT